MNTFQIGGIWPWWLTISLAVLLSATAWWLYFRESKVLAGVPAWGLPTLRSLAILLALLMLIEPSCHQRWQEGEPARLDIVLDQSRSMSVVDDDLATSSSMRLQTVDDLLLAGDSPQLQQWADTHQLAIHTLRQQELATVWKSDLQNQPALPTSTLQWLAGRNRDSDTDEEVAKGESSQPPSDRWGSITALGSAIERLLGQTSGTATSTRDSGDASSVTSPATRTLLLFSDGQNNAGPSLDSLSGALQNANWTIHAIGLGPLTENRDLAVQQIKAPDSVFFSDRLSGTIELLDRFVAAPPAEVKLELIPVQSGDGFDFRESEAIWEGTYRASGQGKASIPFSVDLRPLMESMRAQWRDVEYSSVPITFQIRCTSLNGERSTENNMATFQVSVGTRRQRVLLVAGRSRWEMRFLRNSLERDPNWKVDAFLLDQKGPHAFSQGSQTATFPQTLEALLDYDLIILGELPVDAMPANLQAWIVQFVGSTGGGLMVVDGARGYWGRNAADTLSPLLPVTTSESFYSDAMPLQLTPYGSGLGLTQLDDQPDNTDSIWKQLPGMRRTTQVQVRPGGQVLANLTVANQPDQQYPWLVSRLYGAGRVFYVSTDESWRWRYVVEDLYHQRFWNQAARWVMRTPFMVDSQWVALDCGQPFYPVGQNVSLRVRLKGLDGQPSQLESLLGSIRSASPDSEIQNARSGNPVQQISLTPVPDYPGVYQGQCSQLPAGQYQFAIQAPGYQPQMINYSVQFAVTTPQVNEMADLTCNQDYLQKLCEMTGGRFVHYHQAQQLTDLISETSQGKFIESDILLWQSYLWFIPIVLLLGWEWWIRKQVGLI